MRALRNILLCCLASFVLYAAVFVHIRRPINIEYFVELIETKQRIAAQASGSRLFVFGGSNGRYSHRCQTIEPLIGQPCVNLSVAVTFGLDYVMESYRDLFRPGDVLYMPWEYRMYVVDWRENASLAENAILCQRQHDLAWRLGWERAARACLAFNLSFLVQGIQEMALVRAGANRFEGEGDHLTPQGDQEGHTAANAVSYRDFVARLHTYVPTLEEFQSDDAFGLQLIARFVRDLSARGVTVIGGLPTTFDDEPVPQQIKDHLAQVYRSNGGHFLTLPSQSLYPREGFYDRQYHLNEEWQIRHSQLLAQSLIGSGWLTNSHPDGK